MEREFELDICISVQDNVTEDDFMIFLSSLSRLKDGHLEGQFEKFRMAIIFCPMVKKENTF